ncbi:hypothetical protein KI387_003193, partial [Taxus chinensis]
MQLDLEISNWTSTDLSTYPPYVAVREKFRQLLPCFSNVVDRRRTFQFERPSMMKLFIAHSNANVFTHVVAVVYMLRGVLPMVFARCDNYHTLLLIKHESWNIVMPIYLIEDVQNEQYLPYEVDSSEWESSWKSCEQPMKEGTTTADSGPKVTPFLEPSPLRAKKSTNGPPTKDLPPEEGSVDRLFVE